MAGNSGFKISDVEYFRDVTLWGCWEGSVRSCACLARSKCAGGYAYEGGALVEFVLYLPISTVTIFV